MTSSIGNIFLVTSPLWGEFTGLRRIPYTKASDAEQSWCWWFETPLCSLWRHCNVYSTHGFVVFVLLWLCYRALVIHMTYLHIFSNAASLSLVKYPAEYGLNKSNKALTLNMLGPSYLGLTMSISWLLMPLLLTSPGHQQLWYWLCKLGK